MTFKIRLGSEFDKEAKQYQFLRCRNKILDLLISFSLVIIIVVV